MRDNLPRHRRSRSFVRGAAAATLVLAGLAQAAPDHSMAIGEKEYYEAPAANLLVFSNTADGLFADAKIAGVEIIQQSERIATNGDVRLSATPGQWDPIGRVVARRVDRQAGVIEVDLEYADPGFRYTIRTEPVGKSSVRVRVILPAALPPSLVGHAGFTLEFLPVAYFHQGYLADGAPGIFPLHPTSGMTATAQRNAASGRSDGGGAEPLPMASAQRFVLAPSDPARRVGVQSAGGPIALYDGRAQAQNGWFVLRGLLPGDRTGPVLDWTIELSSDPGWLRQPVIGHSQLGYTPGQAKIATIELDRNDRRAIAAKLLRIAEDGSTRVVAQATPPVWGDYLRYRYRRFDFSSVRETGLYLLEYGDTRTAPFRISPDIYADAWHASLGVYLPVQMDHMSVNEAYRVWHGDPHRLHRAFPDIVPAHHVFDALAYLHGHHPASDVSFVSGVGTRSKEVAYGSNRADFSYIAGGVVPGVLILKPDFPENKENWPFLWGENEYVVDLAAAYIELVNSAQSLVQEQQ